MRYVNVRYLLTYLLVVAVTVVVLVVAAAAAIIMTELYNFVVIMC